MILYFWFKLPMVTFILKNWNIKTSCPTTTTTKTVTRISYSETILIIKWWWHCIPWFNSTIPHASAIANGTVIAITTITVPIVYWAGDRGSGERSRCVPIEERGKPRTRQRLVRWGVIGGRPATIFPSSISIPILLFANMGKFRTEHRLAGSMSAVDHGIVVIISHGHQPHPHQHRRGTSVRRSVSLTRFTPPQTGWHLNIVLYNVTYWWNCIAYISYVE